MKVLVTGGSGLLGLKLTHMLEEKGFKVITTFYQNPINKGNAYQLDVRDDEKVKNLMTKEKPDVIIHTTALTNVDFCELNKETAFSINVQGSINIAKNAKNIDALVIYISTDYVFDGQVGFYKENDIENPINYYGLTKYNGEKVIKEICKDYIIARSSVIYGSNKINFVLWAIDKLRRGSEIDIAEDQYVSPTLNIDLAEQLISLINGNARGVFHTAGGERINRYDFVRRIADVFGLKESYIHPVLMKDVKWVAPRPKDSSLDVTKITRYKKPLNIGQSLELLKDELRRNNTL